jgi:hypothetical protein
MSGQDLQGLLSDTRGLMNDVDADLIEDDELIQWLNEGLVHLTLKGQMLEDFHQFDTVVDQQEYPLPYDDGDIKEVFYFSGSRQYRLKKARSMGEAMEGTNNTSSILLRYYKRHNSHVLMQKDSTAALTRKTRGSRAKDRQPIYVIGLYPIPSVVTKVTIAMYVPHPRLRQMTDRVLIPFRFHFGAVAYALFKCYSKEKAYAEANHYQTVFTSLLEQAEEWSLGQGEVGHKEVIQEKDDLFHDLVEWPGRAIVD